jgi:hypothetical protein
MITNEQILELAEQFLEEWGANDQDGNTWKEYSGTTKDIIEFARAIYEMGNDNGWQSREEAEYFNSSYPTGLVGDPQ